jgi:hypothetical protein
VVGDVGSGMMVQPDVMDLIEYFETVVDFVPLLVPIFSVWALMTVAGTMVKFLWVARRDDWDVPDSENQVESLEDDCLDFETEPLGVNRQGDRYGVKCPYCGSRQAVGEFACNSCGGDILNERII